MSKWGLIDYGHFSVILTITILTISFLSSQQRVRGMLRVLKKSRRMRSTQLLRSSPKKSLRSWRWALAIGIHDISRVKSFLFSLSIGCEGGQPYERRTVTFAVKYSAIHTDITFFIKRSKNTRTSEIYALI